MWHSHKRHFGNDWSSEGGKWEQTEVPVSEDLEHRGVLDQPCHGAQGVSIDSVLILDGWDDTQEIAMAICLSGYQSGSQWLITFQ